MSYKNIQELTLRLSSALDHNYNVIKLEEVFSVINALESTAITKDQLETTRLAKYINQLRRRTTNEHLAKRAKCLLKKWREKLLASNDNKKTNAHHTSFKLSAHHNNNENSAQLDFSQNFHLNHGHSTYRRHTTQSLLPTIDCNNFTKLSKRSSSRHAKPSMSTEILSYDVLDNTNSGFDDDVISVPLSHNNKSFNNSNNSNIKCVNDVPIVIDLHDTNSMDMSIATNTPTICREFSIAGELSAIGQIVSSPNSRYSMSKRKNSNLEYEDTTIYSTTNTMPSTTITPIQQRDNETAMSGGAGVSGGQDTKTHSLYNLSISDILSLSNSSMGSEKQRYGDVAKENSLNTKQNTSDLTFAGKFKKKSISTTTNCLTNNSTNNHNELSGFNYFGNNEREPVDSAHQKFAPFASLMSINSNDSTTSNSHILTFDMSQEQRNKSANMTISTATPTLAETVITPTKIALNESQNNKVDEKINRSENSVGIVSSTELKVPKKRGRKKGSKGVDATIAKETSLSSEMLIRGNMSCKKVKTTKELYAEMKNRKFGLNSSPSPQGCSEPSVNSSPTLDNFSTNAIAISSNATNQCIIENIALLHTQPLAEKDGDAVESDCFTLTSEPSRDSAPLIKSDVDNNCINANSMLIDSNSNSVGLDIAPSVQSNVIIPDNSYHTSIATVREQLYEIICNLPPMLNYHDIEIECQADVVPCTCRVIQIQNHNEDNVDNENDTIKVANCENDNSNKGNGKSSDIVDSTEAEKRVKHNVIVSEDRKQEEVKQTSITMKKVVPKSIFDVDFDDDNDPLPTIIADLKANQFKLEHSNTHSITHTSSDVASTDNITIGKDGINNSSSISTSTTKHMTRMKLSPSIPAEELLPEPTIESVPSLLMPPVPVTSLITEIDDKCPAKYRFEIQTQNITEFHINALHNFYIPNVNGNWNEAFVLEPPPQYKATVSSPMSFYTTLDNKEKMDGCNVVPKYGVLIKENLIKNLSQVSLSECRLNQSCKLVENSYEELKFFGVIQTSRYKNDVEWKTSKDNFRYKNESVNTESDNHKSFEDWNSRKCINSERNLSLSTIINENNPSTLPRNMKINENVNGNGNGCGNENDNENENTTKCFEYISQKKNNNKRRRRSVTTTFFRNNGKHLEERENLDKDEEKKMENEEETELQQQHQQQYNHQDSQRNCNSHTINCSTATFQMNLNTSSLSPCENDSNHSNISCDKDNQSTVTHLTRNGQILDKMPFHENDSKLHHEKQFQGRRKRRKKFQNQCGKREKKIHRVLFFHDELPPITKSDDYILNINNNNSNCCNNINSNSNSHSHSNNNSNITNANGKSSSYSNNLSDSSSNETEYGYSDDDGDDDDKDDYTENVNIFTQNHITVHNNINNNNNKNSNNNNSVTTECCSINQNLDNNDIKVDNLVNVNMDTHSDNYDDLLNVLKHSNEKLEKLEKSDIIMDDDDVNLNAIITVTATTSTTRTTTSTMTIITAAMPTVSVVTAATSLLQQNNMQNSFDIENRKTSIEDITNYNNNIANNNNSDNDDNVDREFHTTRDELQYANNNAQLLSINKIYQETKLQIEDDHNVGDNGDNSSVVYTNHEMEHQLTAQAEVEAKGLAVVAATAGAAATTTITTTTTTTAAAATTTINNKNKNENEHLLPLPEYRHGWRQVNEGINNCQHWQQFAEWHQVLQLRSYNNELLTVLPYVVIE